MNCIQGRWLQSKLFNEVQIESNSGGCTLRRIRIIRMVFALWLVALYDVKGLDNVANRFYILKWQVSKC